MAVRDLAIPVAAAKGVKNPCEVPAFVLLQVHGIERMSFRIHYKALHSVIFQSAMRQLRAARDKTGAKERDPASR